MIELIIRTLEELDGAEARLVLLDLPPMDVDRVSHLSSPTSLEIQATSVCRPFAVKMNGETSAFAIHHHRCHYQSQSHSR
jgi:hypothetical protein